KYMTKLNLNKGISTSTGVLIIIVCALLAGGIFAWQYKGIAKESKLADTEKIEKTQTQDETADWKVYQNNEHGYELKHPKDIVIAYSNEQTVFKKDSSVYYSLVVSPLTGTSMFEGKVVPITSLSPKNLIVSALNQRCKTSDVKSINWASVEIEGIKGMQALNSSDQCINQYLPWSCVKKDNYAYNFKTTDGAVNEHNQILSTFKFIK
ncbi:MAG: hypothetical protein U9P88_00365, partial [Patescibacteria group bacterium]|nr:hypothetical protein [Patescibacteria group bacterium]